MGGGGSLISKDLTCDFNGSDTQHHISNFGARGRGIVTRTIEKYNLNESATILNVTTWPDYIQWANYERLRPPYRAKLKGILGKNNAISENSTSNQPI